MRQAVLWLAMVAATSGCCCGGGGGPWVPPAAAGNVTISARVPVQYSSLVAGGDCGDSITEAGHLSVDQTAIRLDHFDYSYGSRHLTLSGTLRCAPVSTFITPTVFPSG